MSVFRPYMTDAMLAVYDGFAEEMEKECLYCLEKLRQANVAGNISLPHETEKGVPVVHGARVDMERIADYWYIRLQNAARFVSSDFEEKHELYSRYIGIRNKKG